jgi:hypothetical protein
MDLATLEQRTLARTERLHSFLYPKLEAAVERARLRAEEDGYDPWYFSHSVRFFLCRAIDDELRRCADKKWFTRRQLALSGIELKYQEFVIKVFCGIKASYSSRETPQLARHSSNSGCLTTT